MNHRGSGVTEDSSTKYAKERQKFFGFSERRLPPATGRVRVPLLSTLQESISVAIAEIAGLENTFTFSPRTSPRRFRRRK
jgi:hypothetical protein